MRMQRVLAVVALVGAVFMSVGLWGCGETTDPAATDDPLTLSTEVDAPPSQASDATAPALESAPEQRTAEAAVAALDGYRMAAAAGEGTRAVEYLHPSYFEMTARQIDAALDADAATVAAMGTMDRLMVYALRFGLEPEELRTLTPKALAALALDRGWIDDEVTGRATVARVRLLPEGSAAPERALVSLEYEGTPVDAPITVAYHEGRWLVDLVAMMTAAGASLERMADQFGLPIEEFIRRALMAAEGRALPDDIDQPVGRR